MDKDVGEPFLFLGQYVLVLRGSMAMMVQVLWAVGSWRSGHCWCMAFGPARGGGRTSGICELVLRCM